MKNRFQPKFFWPFFTALFCIFSLFRAFSVAQSTVGTLDFSHLNSAVIKKELDKSFTEQTTWPATLKANNQDFSINYTFNQELVTFIKKLLKQYRSDYSSIVVIDNSNGEILAAIDYQKKSKKFGKNITFSSTHPAASLFKVITAAELLKNGKVTSDTIFPINGKSTTLYKSQLRDSYNRWTRFFSLEKAFAISFNAVFGKAAIRRISAINLFNMANKFGFNQDLMEEITLAPSTLKMAESQFNFAELASGFNRQTTISPVHGSVIASIIANNGILKYPSVIKNVKNLDNQIVWAPSTRETKILNSNYNQDLAKMMHLTIAKGTARGVFSGLRKDLKSALSIGGKTGTITGGAPHGQRDWFIAFAKGPIGQGISLSIMNINQKKWYVKSTFLARKVIEYYFKGRKWQKSKRKVSSIKTRQ